MRPDLVVMLVKFVGVYPSQFRLAPHHGIDSKIALAQPGGLESRLIEAEPWRYQTIVSDHISMLFSPERYAAGSLEKATRQPGPQK